MCSYGCLCVCVCVCVCAPRVGMCACVRLIALVTQAVSHSHCSKLWVGEGHCGADRGDGKERGDGGWVGEKETEEDDNEKLKAARKWDVGLHSSAVVFAARKKKKKCAAPWGLKLSLPLRDESFSVFCGGQGPLSRRNASMQWWPEDRRIWNHYILKSKRLNYVNTRSIAVIADWIYSLAAGICIWRSIVFITHCLLCRFTDW